MNVHLPKKLLGIAIAVILFLLGRTAAAVMPMPEDRTFPIVGWDDGLVLRVGPRTDASQVVGAFRAWYFDQMGDELSWRVLYDANPHGTIAVCRFRKDGPVFNPRAPHDDSIWDGCDPSQVNIALIAGAYLRIPMEGVEPPSSASRAPKDVKPGPAPKPKADEVYDGEDFEDLNAGSKAAASSASADAKPSNASGAPDGILSAVVAQRDAANLQREIATTILGITKAELQKRPTRNKWMADLIATAVLCLAVGMFLGVNLYRLGRKRGPPKPAGISIDGALQAATVPTNSKKTDKASREEATQIRRMPPPLPPPTG